jgi:hypothetical protein
MRGNTDKTAVVLNHDPLFLDALERLSERVGVTVESRTTYSIQQSLDGGTATNPGVHTVVLSPQDDVSPIEAAFAAAQEAAA